MTPENHRALLEAVWTLLEKGGVEQITPQNLEVMTSLNYLDIQRLFPSAGDSLKAILVDYLDCTFPSNKARYGLSRSDSEIADQLFGDMMDLLDGLAPRKPALARLRDDLLTRPGLLSQLWPLLQELSARLLHSTLEKDNNEIQKLFQSKAFSVFILYIASVWLADSTPDQALTMAKLDQGIKKLFEWRSYLQPFF